MNQLIRCNNPARWLPVAVAVALTLLWVMAQAAPAAQDEVHFDPDSPAGKEYALPVDQARDEAAGGGSDGPSGEKAPLFGAGVSPQASPPGSSAASGEAGGAHGASGGQPADRRSHGQRSAEQRAGSDRPSPEEAAVLAAADASYPLAMGVGLAAVVVLLGGAIALALRGARRLESR